MRITLLLLCGLLSLSSLAQRRPGSALVQLDAHEKAADLQKTLRLLVPEAKIEVKASRASKHGIYEMSWDEDFLPFGKLEELLSKQKSVLAWQGNYEVGFRQTEPDDPLFSGQWNLELIRAPRAWDFARGGLTAEGDTIVIAIIDNGFDIAHEDLQGQLWTNWAELGGQADFDDDGNGYEDDLHGWDYNNNGPEYQPLSHGTSVAGIIGARADNETDMAGINWNVQLMLFGIYESNEVVEAYYYILDQRRLYNQTDGAQGAFVVATNASFGIDATWCDDFPLWGAVYDSLGQEGVLSVSAVSNDDIDVGLVGDLPTTCPSEYLITTTNTDRYDQLLAAYGLPYVDLSAPSGVGSDGLPSLKPGNSTGSFGGSSGAAPQVAGAIGLLYSVSSDSLIRELKTEPAQSVLLLRDAILSSTHPLESLEGKVVSGGRLDLYGALLYLHAYVQEYPRPDPVQDYTAQTGWLSIFPNPARSGEEIRAYFGSENLDPVAFRLTDATGKLMFEGEVQPQAFAQQYLAIPTRNLPAGIYFITLRQGPLRLTKKLVVNW